MFLRRSISVFEHYKMANIFHFKLEKSNIISGNNKYCISLRDTFMRNLKANVVMSSDYAEEFLSLRDVFISDVKDVIKNDSNELGVVMEKVLGYNLSGGRRLRSMILIETYKILTDHEKITKDSLNRLYMLGWCMEMLVAVINISDDLIDQSEMRRGTLCWYKLPEVGLQAVNHLFLLWMVLTKMVKVYMRNDQNCDLICSHFNNTLYTLITSQILEQGMKLEIKKNLSNVSMEKYEKFAYIKITDPTNYIFYCALVLANRYNNETMSRSAKFLTDLGLFHQMENDYNDCYGDPEKTGIFGTDIQGGALTWFIAKALDICNVEQYRILKDNYGKNCHKNIINVKRIYNELNLQQEFLKKRNENINSLTTELEEVEDRNLKKAIRNMANAVMKDFI